MIYQIGYTPKAIRMYKKLTADLQGETKKAIEMLTDSENHKSMKVHELSGQLRGIYSARINYSHRILFQIKNKEVLIIILGVGSHDVYN